MAISIAQTPAGRLGTPADTADLVRFLMSDTGAWITGQVLYSNGGFATGTRSLHPHFDLFDAELRRL